jgi:hypothetical protein
MLTDTDRPVSYVQNGLYHNTKIHERAVEEKTVFSNDTKPITVKTGPAAGFQRARNATAERGFPASRGLPIGTRARSQAVQPPVRADRFGTALTLLLSLALVAGGSQVVAQIWANQAMIR